MEIDIIKNIGKEKLFEELEEKFEEAKKELGFKSSFKEIDNIFFIRDFILEQGHVSESFSRQLCLRISNTFNSWLGYLHNFLIPNPGSMVAIMENKMINEEDKKIISKIAKKIMVMISTNNLVGLSKNKKLEAEFIDDSVKLWKEYINPELIKIVSKINQRWKEEPKE